MICSKKSRPAADTAGTVIGGGKMVRACDSCVCRRARWYCAADDAFLCQNCDSSVHSANTLARRHHRVRLQTNSKPDKLAPAWHHGFKRKARTPRPSKAKTGSGVAPPFVPEIETSAEDGSNEEEELLYRVPIFNPVLAEFCTPSLADETSSPEAKPTVQLPDNAKVTNSDTNSNNNDFLAEFLQSDEELAEFAANMESLLGRALDNDSFSMEELGLINTKYSPEECEQEEKEERDNDMSVADDNSIDVKLYEEINLSREMLEINFDCRSGDEEQEETTMESTEEYQEGKRIGLRLDYEAIAVDWAAHGSLTPWVNGERPQFGPDDCWLDHMGIWGGGDVHGLVPGEMGGIHFHEGREARVSRYREKRRTRLFSKKIRYEVRKLNAEKRPRMKGRFVKRASFADAAPASAPTFQVLREE